jgi:TetR/AcrR family transcriptional repressor of mexJK operon
MSSAAAGRRGRPPSAAKRTAILAAATDAFLRAGYRDTSLDAVAAAAGVSKQTIYSHFSDKDSLFMAAVDAARTRTGAGAGDPPPITATDLRGSLTAFGEAVLEVSMSEEVAALRRIMIAELGRRPALRERWNSGGPNAAAMHLAAELHRLVEQGVLELGDLGTAVTQFFALLGGPANNRSLYGVVPLAPADRREIATSAADLFVRAYATR